MRSGLIARFRTLPIWMGSVLIARSLVAGIRSAQRLIPLLLLAYLLFGFRPSGGPLGVAASVGLALVVGWGVGWVFIAVAAWTRRAELAQTASGLAAFPLTFASTAFVPAAGLPHWLQPVARANPMTYGINAARNLVLGEAAAPGALAAIAASLAVAAVAAGFAIRGFSRPM